MALVTYIDHGTPSSAAAMNEWRTYRIVEGVLLPIILQIVDTCNAQHQRGRRDNVTLV